MTAADASGDVTAGGAAVWEPVIAADASGDATTGGAAVWEPVTAADASGDATAGGAAVWEPVTAADASGDATAGGAAVWEPVTAADASGDVTAGGAAAWELVSPNDNVPDCGAGVSGVDAVFSFFCALCWTVLSVVPPLTGAVIGFAAVLTLGGGAALTGHERATDGVGVECEAVAGAVVAGAATCCAGWPGARVYQHWR